MSALETEPLLARTTEADVAPPRRRRRHWWTQVSVVVAAVMLLLVVLLVLLVPFLPDYHPNAQDLSAAQLRPFADGGHLLGTDELGRDVLSRLAVACRVSLLIAVAVVAINVVIGVTLGLIAGYFGGIAETLIMGLADLQLAIPVLILLIAIIAAFGPSITLLVVVLGLAFWVRYGRVTRVIAMSLRQRDFVLAPVTQGGRAFWIMRKHFLPHVVPQLIVMGSFDLGIIVIAEASLSYLGLGVQPPTPSFGGMIYDGQSQLQTNPWLCLVPGIAVFLLLGGIQILSQKFTAEGRVPTAKAGS